MGATRSALVPPFDLPSKCKNWSDLAGEGGGGEAWGGWAREAGKGGRLGGGTRNSGVHWFQFLDPTIGLIWLVTGGSGGEAWGGGPGRRARGGDGGG